MIKNLPAKQSPIELFRAKPYLGFDELSEDLGMTKDEIKKDWESAGLGKKRFFNTKFSDYFKPVIDDRGIVVTKGGRPLYVCIKTWACFTRDGKILVFEEGRKTDLASIPSWAFKIVNPSADWIFWAAVVHDLRCEMKYPNKFKTDWEFYLDMRYFEAPLVSASIVLLAVTFGNFSWYQTAEEEAEREKLRNEIAFWEYVKDKKVYEVMPDVYRKELKHLS